MSKFYAVKKGRSIGIYTTWAECQKQISGFKGAIFKSFKSKKEAEEYIQPEPEILSTLPIIKIYTDGSHQPSIKYLGLGAYCSFEDNEYELSIECNKEYLSTFGIEEINCSNPTAEFLGFAEVLKYFIGISGYELEFYIDYIGVGAWIRGEWKCNETYIKKIKDKCLELMEGIECPIKIIHIDGHSGIEGNDRADFLAKNQENFSTFSKLHEKLSEKK